MNIIYRLYEWLHDRSARADEKGEYSAGAWQDLARLQALAFLEGMTGKVLEIGCGEGLFLAQLALRAPAAELYGIDNDRSRVALAEKRLAAVSAAARSRLTCAEAPVVPYPDGFFDAAVLVNVTLALPSFDAVRTTLAEMARVTKKGGTVIVEYRNADNPLLVLKYRLAPYYDRSVQSHPFTMLAPARVEAALAGLSLSVRRRAYLPRFFSRSAWRRRVAPIIVLEAIKR